MKIFVTGAAGQLGHDVINELALRNKKRFAFVTADAIFLYFGTLCKNYNHIRKRDIHFITYVPFKSIK